MTLSTIRSLVLGVILLFSVPLLAQPAGYTPVPQNVHAVYDGPTDKTIHWDPVAGHGSQSGLITASSFNYSGFIDDYGIDQVDWNFGDGQEYRAWYGAQDAIYHSSYGFDVIFFGNGSADSLDENVSIYSYENFGHTPFPLNPIGGNVSAKLDQVHHFNADSIPSARDMIDLSPIGVTHPDQVEWIPGLNGYTYSYLFIRDNNADPLDIAGGFSMRVDRTYGEFSLTENVIYADGRTTYNVYRRMLGQSSYTRIATGRTGTSFSDPALLPGGATYEYVVTANDLFGESVYSDTTTIYVPPGAPPTAPVPDNVNYQTAGADQTIIMWDPVKGHGNQAGLITASTYDYTGLSPLNGVDDSTWISGDPRETRRNTTYATNYLSSYGFDIVFLNPGSGPDNNRDIFTYQQFDHTPAPFNPMDNNYAVFDQIHYFNADTTTAEMDMVDLSPLGVTHPDQLFWVPSANGNYFFLVIDDNDGELFDLAGGLTFRAGRIFGEFDLTRNIIYADGQTTYNVYRFAQGDTTLNLVASNLLGTSFTDTLPPAFGPTLSYNYVITSNDMFGESFPSNPAVTGAPSFPVEWLYFDIEAQGTDRVALSWATASEQNSSHFEVEKSYDGVSFEKLGEVSAAVFSQEVQRYHFHDEALPHQRVYYRLRQVDLDGAYQYSETRDILFTGPVTDRTSLYPNPTHGAVNLGGLNPFQSYDIQVLDLNGRSIWKQSLSADFAGKHAVDLSGLGKGVYHCVIRNLETGTRTIKELMIR